MQYNNTITIASAGSGKTSLIINEAFSNSDKKSAIITYTINGKEELLRKGYSNFTHIPSHVHISTWYTFLLRHFIRPYQNLLYSDGPKIKQIAFIRGRSAQWSRSSDIAQHYFCKPGMLYLDKVSKFACELIQQTNGLPLSRFEKIFDYLYIDECQDLAGYDLELIENLLKSNTDILMVGDSRQATFSTNDSPKNSTYNRSRIIKKFEEWENSGLCKIAIQAHSYRCTKAICDLADNLFPEHPRTESLNHHITIHDGVFAIRKKDVERYVHEFSPQPLRYNRKTKIEYGNPLNFGDAKGMTFERILIYPHGKLQKYLCTGDLIDAGKELPKIYVAITRAKQSCAFVVNDKYKPGLVPLYYSD